MKVFVIPEDVRNTLDSKRKTLNRNNVSSDNPYTPKSKETKKERLKTISMTPYIYMYSEKGIQSKRIDRKKTLEKYKTMSGSQELYDEETGEAEFLVDDEEKSYLKWQNSQPVLLSNQEYNGEESLYKTTQNYGLGAYNARGDRKFRPTAGVKGLSSEYFSSGQVSFVRQVTVNWTCFTLEDLDFLSERFMTLGRKVYVEWGNAGQLPKEPLVVEKDDEGKPIPNNLLEDDKIEIDKLTGKVKQVNGKAPKTSAEKIQDAILKIGKGNIDAIIGYVDGFEFSQRDDGGFDCTTNLKVNGGSILDTGSEMETEEEAKKSKSEKKKEDIAKAKEAEKETVKKTLPGFQKTISDLPYILNQYIESKILSKESQGEGQMVGEEGHKSSLYEDYTTADSYESELKEKNWAGKMFTGGWFNDKNKYRRTTTLQGLTTETAYYNYNNNAICLVNEKAVLDSYSKSGGFAGFTGEDEDPNDGINKQIEIMRKRQDGEGLFHIADRKEKVINADQCWVRWGWFEDNVINKYFALLDADDNLVQSFRSIKNRENFDYRGELSYKDDATATQDIKVEGTYDAAYTYDEKVDKERYKVTSEVVSAGQGAAIVYTRGKVKREEETGIDNQVSTTTKTHKEFQTPDINSFLFPGKFSLGSVKRGLYVNDKNIHWKSHIEQDWKMKGEMVNKPPDEYERDVAKEVKDLEKASKDGTSKIKTTEELKKMVEDFQLSTYNLDLNETGIIPYLQLAQLEELLTDINVKRPFDIGESFKTNGVGLGKIRNIFINVAKLQKIFENPTVSLGENMNLLFKALKAETNGLMDLKVSLSDDGKSSVEDVDDFSYEEDLIKAEKDGTIYEFPVNTQDSFVESQEIASDIGSKMMQTLLVKQYKKEALKDEGGNIIAQAKHDGLEPLISKNNEEEPLVVGTPASKVTDNENTDKYKTYGQIDGDEDIKIGFQDKLDKDLFTDTTSPAATALEGQEGEDDADKDAEQRLATFGLSEFDYTINGELKKPKEMFDRMNLKILTGDEEDKDDIKRKKTAYEQSEVTEQMFGLLFITNSITISGIAGIKPGMVWTTSYLPKKFKENAHFWTTAVSQTIDSSGWKTSITGRVLRKYVKVEYELSDKTGDWEKVNE